MHFEDFVNEDYDVLDIEFGQRKAVNGDLSKFRVKLRTKMFKNDTWNSY